MTNLLDKNSGAPVAGCHSTHILERSGLKIGFMGFAD